LDDKALNEIKKNGQAAYYLSLKENQDSKEIIKKYISSLTFIIKNKVYYVNRFDEYKERIKEIFEDESIKKIGYKLKQDFIVLKQNDITFKNFYFDVEIAGYVIDSIKNKYDIETLSLRYLNLELSRYTKREIKPKQLDLFSMEDDDTEADREISRNIFLRYC